MKNGLLAGICILAIAASLQAQEVVDRIVATVNGQPILQSDCDVEARYEAFLDGRPAAATATILDRVIDQQLLLAQMKDVAAPSSAEVEEKIAEVRRQIAAQDEDGWRKALARYGMDEQDLRERVQVQLRVLRFVDQRLRPGVHVDAKAVENYYRETFLPQLKQRGAGEAPLADVSARIEEILAQQQMDRLLADWLQELRKQASVRLLAQQNGAAPQANSQ